MYLKIQNPGVAPLEGYTILGVSTTRNSGAAGTIGQFGSGSKHAIGLLLRNNIKPVVFLGKLRLDFDVEKKVVNDGLAARDYGQVRVKLSGQHEGKTVNRTQDLGFSLDYGSYDWNAPDMACREFVSNAIDRTIREENGFLNARLDSRLDICPVGDEQARAKDGYTRIFVPMSPEISQFYSELPWRFLHFSEPELLSQRLLPKRQRGIRPNSDRNEVDTAVIYKNGVFVRRVKSQYPSIFDYNFGDELQLDECRNVNDSTVTTVAGTVIKYSEPQHLQSFLESSLNRKEVWELRNIPSYYLQADIWTDKESKEKISENWRAAYKMVAADNVAVSADNGAVADYVRKKGFKPSVFHNNEIVSTLKQYGIKTSENVLNSIEKDGLEEFVATPHVKEAARIIWETIEEFGMTNAVGFPFLKCFVKNMDAESLARGRYEKDTVYVNKAIADGGVNTDLITTVLEEITHHVTQAGDMSRDLQDFAFTLAARLILKQKTEAIIGV